VVTGEGAEGGAEAAALVEGLRAGELAVAGLLP
jgi:hypothetical protein